MFTLSLKGGLGNELFQIAFLEYLKKETGINFFITSSQIDAYISEHSNISYFNSILKNWSSASNDLPINKNIYEDNLLKPQDWVQLLNNNKSLTIEFYGYFQHYKYVTDEFISKLSFSTDVLNKYPEVKNRVFIHIRGGDYVNHPLHHVKLTEYYNSAIKSFSTDTQFYVFTNDISYSELILKDLGIQYSFITESDVDSLYLMSQCKGGICANSTFSWWGAYLNPNRKLILPSTWFNDPNMYTDGYYFPEATIVSVEKDIWDFIDKVVYINLDHRTDRNEHMKQIVSSFGKKASRYSAIKTSYGLIGCVMSHIEVLRDAIKNNYKSILVLEDDAEWNNFDEGYSILKKLASSPYDVILLGGSFVSCDPVSYKLFSAQTTTAYLVNNHYFQILLDNFTEGFKQLIQDPSQHETYALDMYWKRLQQRDNWFIVNPPLVYQRPDYSDICNTNVDYRNWMNVQSEDIGPKPKQPILRFLKKF